MFESSKKRPRKTKLVPRMYVDLGKSEEMQRLKRGAASTSKKNETTTFPAPKRLPELRVKVEVDSGDKDDWWRDLEREATKGKDGQTEPDGPTAQNDQTFKGRVAKTYRSLAPKFIPGDNDDWWRDLEREATYPDAPTAPSEQDFKGKADKTYRNLAPRYKLNDDDSNPQDTLNSNTVKYKLDTYTEQTNAALPVCLEALKLRRPSALLHYECATCKLFYIQLNDFKRHINRKHSDSCNAVEIFPYVTSVSVSLLAKASEEPDEAGEISDNDLKIEPGEKSELNLDQIPDAIKKVNKLKRKLPYKILSFKCYVCRKSWEHYAPFKNHVLGAPEKHSGIVFSVEDIYSDHIHVSAKRKTEQLNCEFPLYSESDHEREIFKCCKCQTDFPNKADLEIHKTELAICRGCQMSDACQIIKFHQGFCSKFFARSYPKTCECKQRLENKKEMKIHSKSCRSWKNVMAFTCDVCNYTSLSEAGLLEHQTASHKVRTDHFMIQILRKCKSCSITYPGFRTTHHCPKMCMTCICVCGKRFLNTLFLNCHLMGHKGSEKCPTSGKWVKYGCLSTDSSFADDPERQVSFLCNICREMFVDELLVTMHIMEKHTEKSRREVLFCYEKIYPLKKLISIVDGRCFYIGEVSDAKDQEPKIEFLDESDNFEIENDIKIETDIHETEEEIYEETATIKLEKLDPLIDAVDNTVGGLNAVNEDTEAMKVIKREKFDPDIDITENIPGVLSEMAAAVKEEPVDPISVLDPSMDTSGSHITETPKETVPLPMDTIKSEPTEYEEDDIIILQDTDDNTVANESIDSEQTIDQFIENNSEITMMEIEPEVLFNENLAAKRLVRKIYCCPKCDFRGLHRDYSAHLEDCYSNNPRRKRVAKRPPKKIDRVPDFTGYPCSKCNTNFEDLKFYLRHLQRHGIRTNTCPECHFIETSPCKLKQHVLRHLRSNFVRINIINFGSNTTSDTVKVKHCTKCKEVIESQNTWIHWESHLKTDSIKVKREKQCYDHMLSDKDYSLTPELLEQLTKTLVQAIPDKKSMFDYRECPVCENRRFNRHNDFKRHLIEHLRKDALGKKVTFGAMRCQICRKDFERSDSFKKHLREHSFLPLYQCHICDKSFSDSSNFAKHKKVHNLRVLICDICQKKFQCKSMLEKHIFLHTVMVPYKCEICSKEFLYTSQYNKHRKKQHQIQPNEYGCKICAKKFTTMKDKWDHEWEIHRERKLKADCPICGQEFRKNSDVKLHMKTQHNIKVDKKRFVSMLTPNVSGKGVPSMSVTNVLIDPPTGGVKIKSEPPL